MTAVRAVDDAAVFALKAVEVRARGDGATAFEVLDRAGHLSQQPQTWTAIAAALAVGGAPGRRAAARGIVSYLGAAVVANLVIKPLVRRPRPPKARRKLIGPVTTSFPSGHGAADVAFVIGASQELPWLFPPLAAVSLAAHWSLVRTRGHYASDVLVGGAIGILVGCLVGRVWPPTRAAGDPPTHLSGIQSRSS